MAAEGNPGNQKRIAEIEAAQERLRAYRAQLQISEHPIGDRVRPVATTAQKRANRPSWALINGDEYLRRRRASSQLDPRVTGPGGIVAFDSGVKDEAEPPPQTPSIGDGELGGEEKPLDRPYAKNHPSLGLASLRAKEAPLYRVYLWARYLDSGGSGWVSLQDLRETITGHETRYRCFSWRRLRQILEKGAGKYWTRETGWDQAERIRYSSPKTLARKLDLVHLGGSPVKLSPEILASTIGDFKAYLYSSWHCSRQAKGKKPAPITRATLTNLTGAHKKTQIRWEKRLKMEPRRNIAIGEKYSQAAIQERAWEKGTGVFIFYDQKGLQGPRGEYIAWSLPNSYFSDLPMAPRGRLRKINETVRYACDKRDRRANIYRRIFHTSAAEAGKAFSRDRGSPVLWPAANRPSGVGIWHTLGGV